LAACPPGRRGWEWHYLNRLCRGDRLPVEVGPDSAEFSPDGARLAGRYRGAVRVWDTSTGREVCSLRGDFGHWSPRLRVLFSPTGKHLATLALRHDPARKGAFWEVRLWDAVTGRPAAPLREAATASQTWSYRGGGIWQFRGAREDPGEVRPWAFSPDGT